MQIRIKFFFLLLIKLWITSETTISNGRRIFEATKDGFLLDGQKFHVYAGEIHYFRVASCWWKDRLTKLHKGGFNTVSTAIEWAMHEPKPTNYQWSGNANFSEFIELAFQLNLFVIVRAGPFIDADRDLGGLPRWLFKTTNLSKNENQLRATSTEYRYYVEKWFHFLLPKLASRTVANGGPIIMFQIDSDLGESPFCGQHNWLYDIFISYLGRDTIFFTMNDNFHQSIFCGHINRTFPAFRTNPLEYTTTFNRSVTKLFEAIPNESPKLVELHCGTAWFWGGKRLSYDLQELEITLSDLVSYGSSLILYMFNGGTNFERAGCSISNQDGIITSYDYDAPVSETGELKANYLKLKAILEKEPTNITISKPTRMVYSQLNFTCVGSFLSGKVRKFLGIKPVKSQNPLSFYEILDGCADMVLYKTTIPEEFFSNSKIEIHSLGINDRGYVYLDRNFIGTIDHTRHTITTKQTVNSGQRIYILVESQGHRMNPPYAEFKGITSDVYLNDLILQNWTMYAINFDNIKKWQKLTAKMTTNSQKRGICLYRASFKISQDIKTPMDSILDIRMLGKGHIFINAFSLGKYWPKIGPQLYLYVPKCFLKPYPSKNHVLAIEMNHQPSKKLDKNIWIKKDIEVKQNGSQSKLDYKIFLSMLLICIKITFM